MAPRIALSAAMVALLAACHGPERGTSTQTSFGEETLDRWLPAPPRAVRAGLLIAADGASAVLVLRSDDDELVVDIPSSKAGANKPDFEPPDPCCDDRGARKAYERSYATGRWFVRKLARKLPSCDAIDLFAERAHALLDLIAALTPPADPHRPHCLLTGFVAGGRDEIEAVIVGCADRCAGAGAAAGEAAAARFCAEAIAAGAAPDPGPWLRDGVETCGLFYEILCDSAFLGDTTSACPGYTTGADAIGWDHTREHACDYGNRADEVSPRP
jgi:hypothetical protein